MITFTSVYENGSSVAIAVWRKCVFVRGGRSSLVAFIVYYIVAVDMGLIKPYLVNYKMCLILD